MPAVIVAAQLPKIQGEVSPVNFEFKKRSVIAAGQTITTASALSITPSDGGLTAATGVVNGTQVQYLLTGGTLGALYTLTCTITTSGGCTLICRGQLEIVA